MALQLVCNTIKEGGFTCYKKQMPLFRHMGLLKKHTGTNLGLLGVRVQDTSKPADSSSSHELHVSTRTSYPATKELPLPTNVDDIDDSKLACFSPQRDRDINGSVILSQMSGSFVSDFGRNYNSQSYPVDPHIASYDCQGAVSLNSAMQTNVPEPFASSGKSTHLNMPGGQWSQGQKYIAQDLQNTHYTTKSSESSRNSGSVE